jgi:O-antigen ligase
VAVPADADRQPDRTLDTARDLGMNVDAVLIVLGAAILTNVWRVQDIVPQLGVFRPAILSIVAAAFFLLLDRSPERRERRFSTPVTIPLLIYLALTAVLIPASLDPQLSTSFLVKETLATGALALMITAGVRSGRDLEWLVLVHVLGASFYCLYALLRVPLGPEGHWINIIFYDNNDFALVAVSTIPFALFLLQSGRKLWWRATGLIATALLFLCVIRTGSRGGLLGLVAVLGYLALRHRTVAGRARLGAVVVAALVVAVLGRNQIAATVTTLRNPKADYNWAGNDYDGRIELWKRGIGYMRDRPLTGVGLAAFPVAEGQLSEVARERMAHGQEVKTLVAHNMYIQVGAELGLIVLGVFLFLLYRMYHTAVLVARAYEPRDGTQRAGLFSAGPETTLPRLLAASVVGFCFSAVFIAAAYMAYFPLLVGFAGAMARVAPAWITASKRRRTFASTELGNVGVGSVA